MSFSTVPILEYQHFFEEEGKSVLDYLSGISKEVLQKLTPSLLTFDFSDDQFSDPKNMLTFWLGEGHPLLKELHNKYENLVATLNIRRWRLVFPYSSLRVIEEIQNLGQERDDSQDPNLDLLKAYLLINEHYVNYFDQKISETTKDLDGYMKGAAMICCMALKDNDITNYNINVVFGTSLIKAVHLFEYMDSKDYFQPYITQICSKYKVGSWKEYVLKLTGIVRFAIGKIETNKYTQVTFDEEVDLTIFDDLNFDFTDIEEQLDFIKVRSNPLIKVDDRTYILIFDLFVVQKLYKGLYWLLMSLAGSQKEKNELRQRITYEFSEKYLLYKTLNDLFPKSIKFSGEDIGRSGIDGFVDFYIRNANDIYLFESKDVFIGAKTKISGDWEVIKKDLKTKFHSEVDRSEKIHSKAILQLLNSIKIIIEKKFRVDSNFKNINGAIFYPILVVHDEIFNVPGLSIILNNWFREELLGDDRLRLMDNRIKGITLVDINTIIFNKSIFIDRPELLKRVINKSYLDFRALIAPTELRPRMNRNEVEDIMVPFENKLDKEIPEGTKRSPDEFLKTAMRLFDS